MNDASIRNFMTLQENQGFPSGELWIRVLRPPPAAIELVSLISQSALGSRNRPPMRAGIYPPLSFGEISREPNRECSRQQCEIGQHACFWCDRLHLKWIVGIAF